MILYPMIELLDGRCVSLFRGRIDEPHIWHVDPVAKAKSFAKAGAAWLHITDFDAMSGDERNTDLIREIIRTAGISVQMGGGFRSLERIAEWIDHGAGRIVVGTLALHQPDMVKEAAKLFPDQIVLAVDVFEGFVVSQQGIAGATSLAGVNSDQQMFEFGPVQHCFCTVQALQAGVLKICAGYEKFGLGGKGLLHGANLAKSGRSGNPIVMQRSQ